MIKLENVNKYFNKGKSNQIHVINNTSLVLPDAGIVCLLGPSGCGKTTLLNAIGGLDKVNSGKIYVNDELITRYGSGKIDTIRNASIGYIFQNFNLLDDRTVYENVAIALRMVGIKDESVIENRVRYCLKKVGIDQYRKKLASSLSGGQRQRVAIARAIVKNPAIIIADEPTGNLDSANTLEIMNIIKTISKDRLVILVTHEREIAHFYSDHIAEMKDGRIVDAYSNDSSRYLDYQLENKIYLQDMPVHNDYGKGGIEVDVYSDEEQQAGIKLVIRGGNLYIDTGGRFDVVDENSNVELVDDHYTAMDETFFEENDFDYTAELPEDFTPKYRPVYRLGNMLSIGWDNVKNAGTIRKVLMFGFVFAAMFAFLAVSNVMGIIDVDPLEYRTTNPNYITVSNPDKTEALMDVIKDLDTVEYVLPGETRMIMTMPLDDFIQTSRAEENYAVSIALTSVLKKEQLVAGKMPKGKHDVVIDKSIAEEFLRSDLGKPVGMESINEFIGRRFIVPNLRDYKIVGICDTKSPTLFVHESQAIPIFTNGAEAKSEFHIVYGDEEGREDLDDPIRSGRVMDLELSKNKIVVKEGREPEEAYETIVNISHKNEVKLGAETELTVGKEPLKIVGFYVSDNAIDDTYYVSSETIKAYYIGKNDSFTLYTENPAGTKALLDAEGVASRINDKYDREAYVTVRKDSLSSALLVAGVVMLIALVEMFLMLRSSFLSRIKEVGVMRAIGLKKGDVYRMFTGEIIVITVLTAIPGIALMYFILTRFVGVTYYLDGLYSVTPLIALVSFALILLFNLLAGLIPVFVTMRKTPAQILARTDI